MIMEIEKNGKKRVSLRKPETEAKLKKAVKTAVSVTIDFPLNGDRISAQYYGVRISAPGGRPVQISIDGGEWKPCRESAGHFWFDWTGIPAGEHKLTAQIQTADGKFKKSKIVKCWVK